MACSVALPKNCTGAGFPSSLFSGSEAIVADAADFGTRDGNLDVAITRDLIFELLVKAGFEFADLAATEAGDMNVVARAVGFVVVAIAPKVQEVKLVNEAFFLQQVDGAVDGDEVNFRADFLSAIEDLINVEMLLGSVHDLENDAALASKTNTALAQGVLKMAGGFGSVNAFAARDAVRWSSGHESNFSRRPREAKGGNWSLDAGLIVASCEYPCPRPRAAYKPAN